ncbi:BAHD family acyltransferase [Selaginella moellendorffii]|uniref:BAHD family acyltransferase n=2 Tax=Selaginella moellendorffii TaxID=88036 RepID=D8RFM6_SELML|nr:BAHD family acyltransferase [Selaginella moellendorffii]
MGALWGVDLKSTSVIVPASPTPIQERRFLSNLDQVFTGQWYMNTVWYFKPASDHLIQDQDAFFKGLKDSLSRLLIYYPSLAGRLVKNENNRFEVELNDKGVIFREAVTEARFDDWKDIKDCTVEAKLTFEDTVIADYSSAPLVRIQATLFKCGGIALGFSMAHAIHDGWAAVEFVKSWSELHTHLQLSTPPVYASHLMKARDPPVVSVPIKDYISVPKVEGSLSSNYEVFEEGAPSPYQAITFRFTAQQVDEIIQEVRNGPWQVEASSFVAMAAFTWKVMTEARELPDDTTTRYVYPISCRQRWQPPLPRGFAGNTAHLSSLAAKAGDIKNKHVSYAAKLIYDDLSCTTAEYLKSVIDWMEIELQKNDRDIGFACNFYSGTDVQSTSMVNFPIFEVDFGWGTPIHNSFTFQPLLGDGHAYLFPSPEGGRSRLVPIYMKRLAMKNLFRNELFRRFQPGLKDYSYYSD